VYTFLVPFFVILLGVIFLGESIHISTVIGSTITIIALLVINNVKLSDFRL